MDKKGGEKSANQENTDVILLFTVSIICIETYSIIKSSLVALMTSTKSDDELKYGN